MADKFTVDKAERAKWLRDVGVPITKIARKWHVSRQTIYNWLERLEEINKTSS